MDEITGPGIAKQPYHDTTLALMQGACMQGHAVYYTTPDGVAERNGETTARMRQVLVHRGQLTPQRYYEFQSDVENRPLHDVDIVLIRHDPTPGYDRVVQRLQLAEQRYGHIEWMNPPSLLREDEKILGLKLFPDLMVPTLLTQDVRDIAEFLAGHQGGVVKKTGYGSFGGNQVLILPPPSRDWREKLDDWVRSDTLAQYAVQPFQADVVSGDRRIILSYGEVLGCVNRVPKAADAPANMAQGGRADPYVLTPAEMETAKDAAQTLEEKGYHFVGLDMIGGKITEVNITSPTGINEMRFYRNGHAGSYVINQACARQYARIEMLRTQGVFNAFL
jgi:glutathione synthase